MTGNSKLPSIDEAIEMSIRKQREKETVRSGSGNSNEDENAFLEMMNEGANEIYGDKKEK